MRVFTKDELKKVIELHEKWIKREAGGERADLRSANLRSADLSSANLRSADLRSADLSSANLSSANLRFADLSSANLSSANLRFADLSSANLRFADLSSADLSSANLSSANLRSADLSYANLSFADLSLIKESFMSILEKSHEEFVGLYNALQIGTINGSKYEGECACLVGTIAKLRREDYRNLSIDLRPSSSSISERWFLAIRQGDIPRSNQVSKITCEWIEEFAKSKDVELPTYGIYSSFHIDELMEIASTFEV